LVAFVLRRILQSAAVMAVVAFVAFGLFNFTGDPVSFMVGQDATTEEKARLRAELGLDRPFVVQFARFVGNAAGRFRRSLRQGARSQHFWARSSDARAVGRCGDSRPVC
jgi:peptide/nickel transport system permease protein